MTVNIPVMKNFFFQVFGIFVLASFIYSVSFLIISSILEMFIISRLCSFRRILYKSQLTTLKPFKRKNQVVTRIIEYWIPELDLDFNQINLNILTKMRKVAIHSPSLTSYISFKDVFRNIRNTYTLYVKSTYTN